MAAQVRVLYFPPEICVSGATKFIAGESPSWLRHRILIPAFEGSNPSSSATDPDADTVCQHCPPAAPNSLGMGRNLLPTGVRQAARLRLERKRWHCAGASLPDSCWKSAWQSAHVGPAGNRGRHRLPISSVAERRLDKAWVAGSNPASATRILENCVQRNRFANKEMLSCM